MPTRRIRAVCTATLIAVIGYCLWGLLVDGLELRKLRAEQQRLQDVVGRLDIRDPSKIALICSEHSPPDVLAWRVRLPKGVALELEHQMVAGGRGTTVNAAHNVPLDLLFSSRLVLENDTWWWRVGGSFGGGVHPVPPDVGEFIHQHWNELTISIAGEDEQLSADSRRVVTLLSVDVPASLMPLAKRKLDAGVWQQLQTEPLLRIEIGPFTAFAARAKARSATSKGGNNE